jgi:hypothetical protein
MNYLSPEEIAKIIMFNKDPILTEAVKKVVLHNVFFSELLKAGQPVGLERHWIHSIIAGTRTEDDATVGRMTRITAEASALVEEGFKGLGEIISSVKEEGSDINVAL